MEDVIEVLRRFLLEKNPELKIGVHDNIIEQGAVDSFGIIELIGYVEKQFKIGLTSDDMSIENFKSMTTIAELIKNKNG